MKKEELLQILKYISDNYFQKKDYISAGMINRAIDVVNDCNEGLLSNGNLQDEGKDKYDDSIKEYKNVKGICINIKEGEGKEPTTLASVPDEGIVKEYSDRYEWEVLSVQGLNLMKAYKRNFVAVEILL